MDFSEKQELDMMSVIARNCEKIEEGGITVYAIHDINRLAQDLMKNIIKNKRDANKLSAFIDFMNMNPDQRFWQGLRNWSGVDKILKEKNGQTKDTFYDGE